MLTSLFASADPIISEFMASNDITIADEDGEYADWMEIHNPDATPADMTGWYLTDDSLNLTQWAFPAVTIPADGYLVVFATKKNRTVAGSELHTNFKLSSGGEYLALVKPDGTTLATEFNEYPAQITDYSYGLPKQTQITDTAVGVGAAMSYRVPTGEITGWNTLVFDDSSWTSATSAVGYERSSGNEYDPYIATDIEGEVYGVNNTIYLRYEFNVTDASKVHTINLLAKYDDGFVAYLNGELLTSANAPASLAWNSKANSSIEADLNNYTSWDLTSKLDHLNTGSNVLAIQLLNQATNSSDLLMQPVLELLSDAEVTSNDYSYFVSSTPGEVNNTEAGLPSGEVSISVPSGVKTSSVAVELTSEEPTAAIYYTLDGSEPDETSTLYTSSIVVSEPAQLRAKAFEPDKSGSKIAVADYSFMEPEMLGYLSDVPVIVMDNFGAGDYPNKGRAADGNNIVKVARQSNVMSFYDVAGDSLPFQSTPSLESRTGCRVRGSSSSTFPRKSLSLEFWDDGDNDDDTISPFGMPAEADWALYAPYQLYDRSLVHNKVSFEFAKLIGASAPECTVVAVFQNKDGGKIGLDDLAGVYLLMEKIERNRVGADFDEMSADGTSGGWMIEIDRLDSIPEGMPADTVQPNFHCAGPNGILEVPDDVDGASGSQPDDISNYYHSFLNFAEPDGYDILPAQRTVVQTQTRAMDTVMWSENFGDEATGYPSVIDVDSWVRYYLVQNFTGNQDAVVLSTRILKRTPSSKIEMGAVWDFDRAYTQKGAATSVSPLWASDRDWYKPLFEDSNFVQAHQDAWQEARRTVISDSVLEGLVDSAVTGLAEDQIAASGITYANWLTEVQAMKDWMVARAQFLDSLYESQPTHSPETREFVDSVAVTIVPSDGGVVYYTVDGSDPRDWGGAVAPTAIQYIGSIPINERTRVTMRTLDNGKWSGKVVQDYYQIAGLPDLVFSEIAYHPSDPSSAESALGYVDSDEFEYLEILNVGSSTVDLTTLAIEVGVSFDFSSASVSSLAPGERVLVVSSESAFEQRHGASTPVAGSYAGTLKNSSEQLVLKDTQLDIEFQNFAYDDGAPWPEGADGDGYSLILKNPFTMPDHSIASNWRASSYPVGAPGSSDAQPNFTGVAMDDDDGDGVVAIVEHYLGTSDSDSSKAGTKGSVALFTLADDGVIYPTFAIDYLIGSDDLAGSAEWSSTLQNWDGSSSNVIFISDTPNGDGTARKVWRSAHPDSGTPQFFRLKVEQP